MSDTPYVETDIVSLTALDQIWFRSIPATNLSRDVAWLMNDPWSFVPDGANLRDEVTILFLYDAPDARPPQRYLVEGIVNSGLITARNPVLAGGGIVPESVPIPSVAPASIEIALRGGLLYFHCPIIPGATILGIDHVGTALNPEALATELNRQSMTVVPGSDPILDDQGAELPSVRFKTVLPDGGKTLRFLYQTSRTMTEAEVSPCIKGSGIYNPATGTVTIDTIWYVPY